MFLSRPKVLHWTFHARDKMRFYRLSEQRVRSVINSPKRVEEGIAPKTVAMMQPASLKNAHGKQTWSQEIWVMAQDEKSRRKIISAWRYPGMTKPKSEITIDLLRKEYKNYLGK